MRRKVNIVLHKFHHHIIWIIIFEVLGYKFCHRNNCLCDIYICSYKRKPVYEFSCSGCSAFFNMKLQYLHQSSTVYTGMETRAKIVSWIYYTVEGTVVCCHMWMVLHFLILQIYITPYMYPIADHVRVIF